MLPSRCGVRLCVASPTFLSGLNKQAPASRSGRWYGRSGPLGTPQGPHVGPDFCKDAAPNVRQGAGQGGVPNHRVAAVTMAIGRFLGPLCRQRTRPRPPVPVSREPRPDARDQVREETRTHGQQAGSGRSFRDGRSWAEAADHAKFRWGASLQCRGRLAWWRQKLATGNRTALSRREWRGRVPAGILASETPDKGDSGMGSLGRNRSM
jgi:hypothetical protein